MTHVDGLGTRLRQLTALLDGAVEQVYRHNGLDFRPRFYPYFCLLLEHEELSVGQFVDKLGFTQPAVTQTLNVMHKAELVQRLTVQDKRTRRYALTDRARALLPKLQVIWTATAAAAEALEQSLPTPLGSVVDAALARLAHEPFNRLIEKQLGQ